MPWEDGGFRDVQCRLPITEPITSLLECDNINLRDKGKLASGQCSRKLKSVACICSVRVRLKRMRFMCIYIFVTIINRPK